MFRFLMIMQALVMLMTSAHAQPLTVDPETIVPLPDRFEMETLAADVPPEIARFQGAWIGTWYDDVRTILVVERVKPDGHAGIIFAHGYSGFYGMYREWWRGEAVIAEGTLTIAGEAMKIPWLRSIREYCQAFTAAGGSTRFELLHGVPGDGHLLRLHVDRWRPIGDEFLAPLARQGR